MKQKRNFLYSVFCFLITAFNCFTQPSFPGASGFGAITAGGRGGVVIEVTNLNDNGPGSFREALNTQGARTIVFRVGGIIELQSELQVTEPYITIAGQTAPGDGIVLKNYAMSVFTHDIIIRGMRFRPGDDADGARPDLRDCVSMETGSHDIIFDHCSFSWGLDENISMQNTTTNVTIQWCIISEALYKNRHPKGPHSMGLLVYDNSYAVSVHHNLLAHNNGRNPLVMGVTDMEFINNVIYDWGYNSEFYEDGAQLKVDIAGNYWKPRTSDSGSEHPLAIDFDSSSVFNSRIYCVNNLDPNGIFLTQQEIQNFGGNAVVFSPVSLMSEQTNILFFTAAEAFDTVLTYAGALHPQRDVTDRRVIADVQDSTGWLLDCIYADDMPLDSGNVISGTDTSIIYDQLLQNPAISPEGRRIDIISGTGAGQSRTGIGVRTIDIVNRIVEGIVDVPWAVVPDNTSRYKVTAPCENNLSGWPVYSAGIPYADSDHDGISDAWESAHDLNPNDPADGNGTNLSAEGYTNLEVYLNEYYDPNNLLSIPSNTNETMGFRSFPNPFIESTNLQFTLPELSNLTVSIYDVYGKAVRIFANASYPKGQHTLNWDGRDNSSNKLAAGIYFAEAKGADFSSYLKLVLEK